jgi:hypothetical protein
MKKNEAELENDLREKNSSTIDGILTPLEKNDQMILKPPNRVSYIFHFVSTCRGRTV